MSQEARITLEGNDSPSILISWVFSIFLMAFAWALYFLQPTSMTLLILPVHYLGIWLFSRQARRHGFRTHLFTGLGLLVVNIMLDALVYDPIHDLGLSLVYYITVNCIHVLWYFALAPESVPATTIPMKRVIQIILFTAAFLCWTFGAWIVAFPICIYFITRTYLQMDFVPSAGTALVASAVMFIFIPLFFNITFAARVFLEGIYK